MRHLLVYKRCLILIGIFKSNRDITPWMQNCKEKLIVRYKYKIECTYSVQCMYTVHHVQWTGKNTENMQTCKKHALLVHMNKKLVNNKRDFQRIFENIKM